MNIYSELQNVLINIFNYAKCSLFLRNVKRPKHAYSHLFLVRSPLQALICIDFAKNNYIERGLLVYTARRRSPRNIFYFNLLDSFCDSSYLIQSIYRFGSLFEKITDLLSLLKICVQIDVKYILIGSVDYVPFQILCFLLRSSLITIDDGVGNILMPSIFFAKETQLSVYLFKFRNPISSWYLYFISTLHLSVFKSPKLLIYHSAFNFDCKINYINLDLAIIQAKDSQRVRDYTSFFIGTDFIPFYKTINGQLFCEKLKMYFVNNYKCDVYLPHPAEEDSPLAPFLAKQTITSCLISEHFIFNELSSTKREIYVYGLLSTSLFLIKQSQPSIKCIAFVDTFLMQTSNCQRISNAASIDLIVL